MLWNYSASVVLSLTKLNPSEFLRTFQKPLDTPSGHHQTSLVELHGVNSDSDWHVLGPFQIGTREAIWGADPLEQFGGFRNLEFNHNDTFPSSLALNGTVGWSRSTASSPNGSGSKHGITLQVEFPDIDWGFSRDVYGWAGLQWQAWTRGSIVVTSDKSQTAILHTDGIMEFWVDGEHFFGGDFFGSRMASPVLRLSPGNHHLNVRLIRDVRAMGSRGAPGMIVRIGVELVRNSLHLVEGSIVIADVVDERLASPLASLSVRNDGFTKIKITNLACLEGCCHATLINCSPTIIWPGQSRPIAFQLANIDKQIDTLRLDLNYEQCDTDSEKYNLTVSINLVKLSTHEPHKYTFLHPGGVVSYAIIRPPPKLVDAASNNTQKLTVLIYLHGAGVDATSEMVRHSLDGLDDLQLIAIYPNGVTPWSGDDWHEWGFADVEAAIDSIPLWMDAIKWTGPQAKLDSWMVTGHSNGGQGTYYAVTHRPDKVIAAAPVSGYTSIQSYIPYVQWREIDPQVMAIIQNVLADYRHEILIQNAKDIPLLLQHGSNDDNVPVYHSRRMRQLLGEVSASEQLYAEYHEIPGQMHWFNGIMTTKVLRQFFSANLLDLSPLYQPKASFSMTVANPGNTGSKNGIHIQQLQIPGQLGKLHFNSSSERMIMFTSNVRRLSVSLSLHSHRRWFVDGQEISHSLERMHNSVCELVRTASGVWTISNHNMGDERRGRQLGSLSAILRTKGCFSIISSQSSTVWIATQISRNLVQYFGADAEISTTAPTSNSLSGNFITVSVGFHLSDRYISNFPLRVDAAGILVLRDDQGRIKTYHPSDHGLGAVFLRPRQDEGLELIVWGSDAASLAVAARLVPTLTGSGQPDFVIMTRKCLWMGLEGVLAMGFFDSHWNVSKSSFYL